MIGWFWGLAVLICLSLPVTAHAQYTYITNFPDTDTITIIQYTGSGGAVDIPSTIADKAVTGIGGWAFRGIPNLTSVVIPDSVKYIGPLSFHSCTNLNSVTLGNGITNIDFQAFEFCRGLTNIAIPNSVKYIGSLSFRFCTNLNSVTFGNGITNIDNQAFELCRGLTNVTIPNSVTHIGDWAFNGCNSLSSAIIGNNTRSIGFASFQFCSSLTNILIGSSVTHIGDQSFQFCTNLMNITIPDGVTSIGDSAFGGCTSLTNMTIGNGVTHIGAWAFNNCFSLRSIVIPDSVSNIELGAFFGCSNLVNISLGSALDSIGSRAFAHCSGLIQITLPISLVHIDNESFADCVALTMALFDGNAPTHGTDVFLGSDHVIVYYRVGTTGWGDIYADRPTALWTYPVNVTLDPQGGFVSPAVVTVTNGLTYGVLPEPTRAVYLFDGWWTELDGEGSLAAPNAVVTNATDMVLYAKWVPASLEITPVSTNFTYMPTGGSIEVTANVTWSAAPNTTWIEVTTGYIGTNNGMVSYSVATNPSTFSRTGGVIVVGGDITRTCLVVQARAPTQRIINVSGNLAFGNVVTGQEATATLTIANEGNASIAVSGINYPEGFSGTWVGGIAAGVSTDVTVVFIPNAAIDYGGTITVLSDATSGTETIGTSGTGMAAHPTTLADASFGVVSNQFGFNIIWAPGMVVVVDACSNLANPVWFPLKTNILPGGTAYFIDPQWVNHPNRYYRLRSP